MKGPLSPGDYIVGLDIGGTKTMAVVYDHAFKPKGRCRKKTQSPKNDEPVADRICKVVRAAIEDSGAGAIRGIGVGSPGPLNPATGVIIDTPNLAWKNFPLAKLLGDTFAVPVAVDNDVNLGTYGEWHFGKVRNCKHVVGVFPGTGIGGGIIADGRLLHGFSGAAGEVGHMTIDINGPLCGCGKQGCLEALASRVAIATQVAAAAMRGDAPYVAAKGGTDPRAIRSGLLAEAIENGDAAVERIVRCAAYYTGIAVGNLINILSPEAIVLGGGLVEAMQRLYIEEVTRAVDAHAMPFLRKGVKITAARLGDDAVTLGAAKLIHERLTAEG